MQSTLNCDGTGMLSRTVSHLKALAAAFVALAVLVVGASQALAQAPEPQWPPGFNVPPANPAPGAPAAPSTHEQAAPDPGNTTVISRTPGEAGAPGVNGKGEVRLIAFLTAEGQRIDQGLVWRVFREDGDPSTKNVPVSTLRDASPTLKLDAGNYIVNAAFGRAYLTRKITVKPGATTNEQFVLNAGGLRILAVVSGRAAAANTVSYNVYSDERDQSGNRATVMTGAKPGLIIRLNAGIYHVVTTYGDANAAVGADVTVEAGKQTEATVAIAAAKVTFKLVTRTGGEALPDTQWVIQTPQGEVVKKSVGALPTHVLAPGAYRVLATSSGKAFRRDFKVENGDSAQVEVMMQ